MSVKVDFVLRSDAEFKGGGDSVQVAEYVRALGSRVDARLIPFSSSMTLRSDAVVHIINIDRPFDFVAAVRIAGARPVVVSPIHHALSRVRRMRSAERGRGLRSVVDRTLDESTREWAGSLVRGMKPARSLNDIASTLTASASSALRARTIWAQVGAALDDCFAVTLLANGEGRDIRNDTGWSADNAVLIPNGAPPHAVGLEWEKRRVGALCVGRIEPRKRVLELAREAALRGLDLQFAGRIIDPASRYARQFVELTERSPYVSYLGELPSTEVLGLMEATRVVINASWVEVQSLVDLEASLSGARVVSFENGNSAEWLGESVRTVASFDLKALVEEALTASAEAAPPNRATYTNTWASAADSLASLYADGVAKRG